MLQIYQSIYIALNQYIALYMCLFYIHHSLINNIEMHTPLNNMFIEVKGIRCYLSWT